MKDEPAPPFPLPRLSLRNTFEHFSVWTNDTERPSTPAAFEECVKMCHDHLLHFAATSKKAFWEAVFFFFVQCFHYRTKFWPSHDRKYSNSSGRRSSLSLLFTRLLLVLSLWWLIKMKTNCVCCDGKKWTDDSRLKHHLEKGRTPSTHPPTLHPSVWTQSGGSDTALPCGLHMCSSSNHCRRDCASFLFFFFCSTSK